MKTKVAFLYKSILAPILIGLGVAVSLICGNPLGAFLFSFGLFCVCIFKANLFTGKAGYWWREKKSLALLCLVLVINLVFGWAFGFFLSVANPELVLIASTKIAAWDFSLSFFIKAILCGMIMYLCVEAYRLGHPISIFFGIPLFILCGFQHCIANIIVLGIASTFSWTIILAIIGNLLGSIIINTLSSVGD